MLKLVPSTVALAAVSLGVCSASTFAQTSPQATTATVDTAAPQAESKESAPAIPSGDPKLEIAVTPFIWLVGFDGTVGVRGISADINKNFFDILDETDHVFGLMGAVDVTYDRFVFQLNGTWTTAEVNQEPANVPAGVLDANIRMDSSWVELFAGYRVIDHAFDEAPRTKRRLTLDAFVGGRFTWIDSDFTVSTLVPIQLPDGSVLGAGASRDIDESEFWADPFIGLRMDIGITDNWNVGFRGDIGGFGTGSDFAWQAFGGLGYRFNFETWSMNLFAGYRAIGQDYTDDGFTWDVVTHGPMMGLSFAF
ncbi:MAG: hypothetical protein JNM94_04130 [Phycisphaerae bacterium]|nr:hypothetical protein [Phycisphaerae bacterium]